MIDKQQERIIYSVLVTMVISILGVGVLIGFLIARYV